MAEAGEAAMATKAATAAKEAERRAAWKQAVAEERAYPKRRAHAVLEAAQRDEVQAEAKRLRAETACHRAEIDDIKAIRQHKSCPA